MAARTFYPMQIDPHTENLKKSLKQYTYAKNWRLKTFEKKR